MQVAVQEDSDDNNSTRLSINTNFMLEIQPFGPICAMDLAFEVKMTRKNKTSFEEATISGPFNRTF